MEAALSNPRRGFSDPERIDYVIRSFMGGQKVTEIARNLRCDHHRVTKTLVCAGIDVYKVSAMRSGAKQSLTKSQQSEYRKAEGIRGPNFRAFTSDEQNLVVREFISGKTADEVALMVRCSPTLITRILKDRGVDSEVWRRKKLSESLRKSYRQGRTVPESVGYGTKVRVNTPFQGTVTMRSQLEATRASYLDEEGVPWFYEIQRFVLADGRTYLPDFWVADCTMEEARSRLGSDPDPSAVLEFLNLTAHRIEDVKGWWGDNHPTYPKVSSFRSQHPGTFNVVVKTKGVWSCL